MLKTQNTKSTYVHSNPWFRVRADTLGNGTYYVVEENNGVFIVALTDEGKIILVDLFRHPTGHRGWEIPAGGIEQGEDFLTAAKRELQEETGFVATKWHALNTFDAVNGRSDASFQVFTAEGLTQTNKHRQSEEGIFGMQAFLPTEIEDMITSGKIIDALSVTAFACYMLHRK